MVGPLRTIRPFLHTYSFCCNASQTGWTSGGECRDARAKNQPEAVCGKPIKAVVALFFRCLSILVWTSKRISSDGCCSAIAVIHEYVCTITASARAAVKLHARPGNVVIRRVVATRAATAWTCE